MHEMLSNGLQNAMKACENMDREAARFVDVRAHRAGAALVISIRNSCSGVLGIEDRMPRSHKQTAGHGIGLSSIHCAAERTDGYICMEHDGKVFALSVVLNHLYKKLQAASEAKNTNQPLEL